MHTWLTQDKYRIIKVDDRWVRVYRTGGIEVQKGLASRSPYWATSAGRISQGYRYTSITSKDRQKYYAVHRLVALAYLGDYSEDLDVDHINGIRLDNNLTNLRMCTRSENIKAGYNRRGKDAK